MAITRGRLPIPPPPFPRASRFAAIEARATQYPASTNDVVWLIQRVRELRQALEEVAGFGGCCEAASVGKAHDDSVCPAIRVLNALNEPNVP